MERRYNKKNKTVYLPNLDATVDLVPISNDKAFIKNLFLMSRTKRYDLKMLVKSLKQMPAGQAVKFVKAYGISSALMNKILEIITPIEKLDEANQALIDYITAEYEKYKAENAYKDDNK